MNKNKFRKICFLGIYLIIALILVLIFKPIYIVSIIIVLAIPAIINFSWLKKSRWPVLLFSVLSGLLFAPPVELMARILNVWDVQSIFYRPLGLIPIENMVFAFLNFFWALSFYKYFTDDDNSSIINKRFKYLIGLYLVFDILIFGLYFYNPALVGANYFLIALIILVIPGTLLFFRNTRLLKKTITTTIFFAILFFAYELVSLEIGSWFWPGNNYWLSLRIFGQNMPLDDIIIWYFMSTPVLIAGYEFFVDDNK
jgi:hypothetical protein